MTPWSKVPIGMRASEMTPGRAGVAFRVDSHFIVHTFLFKLAIGTPSVP